MKPLPPDFWDKPYPGGTEGCWIGAIIGATLSFYLFPGGGRYSFQGVMTVIFTGIGALIGMVVGMLSTFYLAN